MARDTTELDRVGLAKSEFDGSDLGDARRNARLQQIVAALSRAPEVSLPKAMGSEAALEATYRFLGNVSVHPDAILEPHVVHTLKRMRSRRCIVAFDTTELRFGGSREGLGHLSRAKGQSRGIYAHVGLVVDLDKRDPLGVLYSESIVRKAKKGRRSAYGEEDSEALRWSRGARWSHALAPDAICVADREADIFALLHEMVGRNQPFVIRAAYRRRLTDEGPLYEQLDDMELVTTRTIELQERTNERRKSQIRRHPSRSAHTANIEIRSRRVVVNPPATPKAMPPGTSGIEVHLVRVLESDPPEGEAPMDWLLLTNLPAGTAQEVDEIVDAYHARWLIEELFKALKSGCGFEKLQLESVRTVTNALAVYLPIAWLLLRLRHLSRIEPERPGKPMLHPTILACLAALYRQRTQRELPQNPTSKDITWAIASLGGHIRNNGDPGFLVLGRGMNDLMLAVQTVEALGWTPEM